MVAVAIVVAAIVLKPQPAEAAAEDPLTRAA